jgi:hypothetical protein
MGWTFGMAGSLSWSVMKDSTWFGACWMGLAHGYALVDLGDLAGLVTIFMSPGWGSPALLALLFAHASLVLDTF